MENKKHVYDHHEAATDLEQGLLAKSLMDHRRQRQSQPAASGEVKYRLGRVPQHVRDMDDDAYTPRFASIGPLHYSNDAVRSSYSHRLKLAYLHSLITRTSPRDDDDILITLQEYRAGVAKLEEEARDFYDEKIELGSEEFIDMMVLDGCFVLEHLLNYATGHEEPLLHSTHWAPSQLHADLICIENQIPFFVLAGLLERTRLPADLDACRTERQDLLRSLGVHCLLRKDDEELKLLKPSREIHHLLHLYSLALTAARNVRPLSRLGWGSAAARALWKLPIMLLMPVAYLLCATPEEEDGAEKMPNIPSAMDLQRVGIKFKKAHKKPDGGFLDVRLEDGDTLVIPTVSIEQFTAPQLQNLIALEQASPELPDDCSSYAFFMDNLVANPCDVALLEAEGILKSNLGSHKAVVTYFNKLCKGNKLELEGHYLSEVFKKLMERSRNPMYAWLRTLRKKYFSSPWGLVAMLVAVFVFASTVLQTYLSIRSY